MKAKVTLFLLVVAAAALACNFPGLPNPAATPTAASTPVILPTETPLPAFEPLTVEQLKNMTYIFETFGVDQPHYTLINGVFTFGSDPTIPGYIVIRMDELTAFGDLNGDGVEDAIALLSENYGGSGVFVSLAAVLNEEGEPKHVDLVSIGDRPIIHDLSIENGQVVVTATVHGFQDAMCCPTFNVVQTYRLIEDKLILMRLTSETPTGAARTITITAPVDGAELSNLALVSGDITIAPFENNLVYYVFDRDGHQLAVGPVNVNAPDLGAPGTFSFTIDLADLRGVGTLRLVLIDISAADGSILTMDSIEFEVK